MAQIAIDLFVEIIYALHETFPESPNRIINTIVMERKRGIFLGLGQDLILPCYGVKIPYINIDV
jgi:hypothetical protein